MCEIVVSTRVLNLFYQINPHPCRILGNLVTVNKNNLRENISLNFGILRQTNNS